MEKFKQLQRIKEIYENGGNIIEYLKKIGENQTNTIEDILISYDFQSGTYIKFFAKNFEYNKNYCRALANIIDKFENVNSIVEVGVGEATTLRTLLQKLKDKPSNIFGFDISWSRLKFAKEFLNDVGISCKFIYGQFIRNPTFR